MVIKNKEIFIFSLGLLLALSFLIFLSAYITPSVEIAGSLVASYAATYNATEDVVYHFNFTINNTAGLEIDAQYYNITEINVSLPGGLVLELSGSNVTNSPLNFSNFSDGTLRWRNASGEPGTSGDTMMTVINGSNNTAWFGFNATATTPGEYWINVTVLHWNETLGTTWNITRFTFNVTVNDTSAPTISFVNPANNFNYSGTFILNVSITDDYKNSSGSPTISFVNITVFNTTDLVVNYTASNVTGNYWNFSIDTTGFADGVYNITIIVNDTFNNVNSTNITLMRWDNTAPTATFTCTPANVQTGAVVTCTCTPSDATAGVNTSQTTYTALPSTANTGTISQSCGYSDTAGNSATTTTSFIVELSAAGSGGGSGSGTTSTFAYSKTIPQNSKEFSEFGQLQYQLKSKERVKVMINAEEHYIGVREVKENSAIIEIASNPVQIELSVGEDAKVDTDEDDYYDVYVKLNSITGTSADITMGYINELKVEGTGSVSTGGDIISGGEAATSEEGMNWNLKWIIIIGIIVAAFLIWFLTKKK